MAHSQESYADPNQAPNRQHCFYLCNIPQHEDDDYDIGADVGADVLDPRVVNLRRGPAEHSYAGGGNLSVEDVQVESEWTRMSLRKNLVQHYMYCFRSNVIKW
jgi:hypothetical protein